MKKKLGLICITLICTLAMGILAGCGGDPEKIQSKFLEMLDVRASTDSIGELEDYLDENLKYMDEKNADEMVIAFEDYAFAFDNTYLKYAEMSKRYQQYTSEALTELYAMKGRAQSFPATVDAVLVISWEELTQRARDAEAYIQKYKDVESVKQDAEWMYSNYINAMLMGTTGTPIFDLQTGDFSEEARKAYDDVAVADPKTTVQWVISEYEKYLESISYNLNYNDPTAGKVFFDTCSYLVSEAGKRVYQ